jgi:tripartite-type tricarboxylate transporter receptor subunit TctC
LLCVSWHSSPIKVWSDMLTKTFSVGAGGYGGDTQITAHALKSMLGAKIKLVGGYLGTAGVDLAMERGEIDGHCGYSWSTLKAQHGDWIRDRKINLLIQTALEKHRNLTDVPNLSDLINAEQRQVLKLLVGTQSMARPFLGPPELPADRKAALRGAFAQAMNDPAFLAEAARMSLDVDPMSGSEIDSLMSDIYSTPKRLIDEAAAIINN